MIVKPRKKHRKMEEEEIRVIHVKRSAIAELLWEHLMEHQETYFDIDPVEERLICHMGWSQDGEDLTYAVMPISCTLDGKELDFDAINAKTGVTTESLFQPNRYRRLKITPTLLQQKEE